MLVKGGLMNNAIRQIGRAIQAIREVGRIQPTSSNDALYFGEFIESLKGALMPKGSELGLGLTLFSLVVSTRAERVIEIGRFKGFSTLALASGLRFVDLGWQEPPEHLQRRHEIDYGKLHQPKVRRLYSIDVDPMVHAEELIEKNNLSRYVEFINGDSREVELDTIADIVFIDGDHSYKSCRGDVDKFVPTNLRAGGYFILHDYFGYYDSEARNRSAVKVVCDELIAEKRYEHILVDTHFMSFMVFRKLA